MRIRLGLLALGLLLANSVLAQGTISVRNVTGAPGDKVSLPISIDNVPNLQSLRLQLEIGGLNTMNAVTGFTPGAAAGKAQVGFNVRSDNGLVEVALAGTGVGDQAITSPGDLGTLQVTIPTTAKSGDTFPVSVVLAQAEPASKPGTFINVSTVSGVVVARTAGAQPTLSVRNIAGAPGSTVYVNVAVDALALNLGGIQFKLDVGTGSPPIAFAGPAQKGKVFSGPNDLVQATTTGATQLGIVAATPQSESVSGPGSVVSVPVAIPPTATAGATYPLTLSGVMAIDSQNKPITFNVQSGTLTILGATTSVVTLGSVTGAPGQKVLLPINVTNVPDLQSLRLQLEIGGLDPTSAIGKFIAGPAAGAAIVSSNVRADTGLVDVGVVGTGQGGQVIKSPGLLGTLEVTIPSNAKTGDAFPISVVLLQAEPVSAPGTFLSSVSSTVGSVQVLQAGATFATVSVGDAQGKAGDVVMIPVSLDASLVPLGGVQVTFNTGALVAQNAVTANPAFASPAGLLQTDLSKGGQATVVATTTGSVSAPSILFNLPVKIPDTAAVGTAISVSITKISAVSVSNTNVSISATKAGTVTVTQGPNNNPNVNVTVDSVMGQAGTTVNVPVELKSSTTLGAVRVKLTLDNGLSVDPTKVTPGALFAGAGAVVQATASGQTVDVAAVTAGSTTGPGVLFNLPVAIAAGATGKLNITITPVQAIDQNNLPVATGTFVNGVVTVTTVIVPQTVSLSVVNVTGKPGDTVPVKVLLGSTVQLGALRVAVTLPAGFTLNGSVVNGTVFTGKNDQIQANANGQTVDVVLVTDGTAAGPGDLFTLPVKIPTTATSGDQPVGLSLTQAIDVNNKPVAAGVITGGKITVTPGGPTTPSPIVKVDDTTIAQGQTGNVTVELTSPSQLGALMFRLTLSSGLSVASPVTLTPGTLFNGKSDIEAANVRSNGQIVDVALVSPTSAKGPGVLFTLPVTAALTATDPQTITVSMVTASDVNNVAVPPGTPINGTIHITPAGVPQPKLDVTVDSVTGMAGTTVNVPVELKSSTTLGAVRVKLTLDNGLSVDPTKVTPGALFAGAGAVVQATASGQTVDVAAVTAGSTTGPGVLFNLPVAIAAGATGKLNITITPVQAIDQNNLPVATGTFINGVVTVTTVIVPQTVSLSVVNVTGKPGDTVPVKVLLGSTVQLGALRVAVTLPAGFTLNGSVVNGTVFTGKNDQIQANANGQTVDVVLVTDGTAAGPGDLFTLPVKIPTTATSGDQPVGLSLTQAIDVNNKPVAAGVITGGKITVTPGGPTTPSPIVKVDDTTIAQGQTGNVTVELTSPSQLGALMFRLTLSSGLSVASPVTLTPGTLFNGKSDIEAANVRSNGQIVDVALVSPTSAKGPGVLFTLPVTAALTATDPQTITVSMVTASDVNNVAVPPGTPINGTIHITPAGVPQPKLDVTVDSVTGMAGTTVNVPVELKSSTTLGAVRVKLTLDNGLSVDPTKVTPGALFAGAGAVVQATASGQTVDVAAVTAGSTTGPGVLFNLPVAIAAGATGKLNITITPVQAIDQNNLPVATGTFINGVVTVTTVIVPQTVSLSVVNVTGKPGDTVPVKVLLGSTVQLGALRVAVTLPAGFTLNGSVVNGTVFTGKNDQIQANANGQTVDVVLVTDGTAAGPGDLFTLPVKIPTTATSGDQPVGLSLTQAIDVNNKPVAAGVITGGKITVTPGGPTTPSPIVKVDDTTIAQGQTGNVTVELTSPSQLGALMFRLTLSSGLSVASPVTLTPGTLFNGKSDIEAANVRSNGQIVDVALVSPTSAKGPGVLFTLPVTAALTATDPQTITVSMVTASDVNNVAVPPGTPINGTIHITPAGVPQPKLDVTVDSVTGMAGTTVNVPVELKSSTTLGAVRVKLTLDNGLSVDPTKVTPGALFAGAGAVVQATASGQTVDVAAVTAGSTTGPGVLFNLPVAIAAGATGKLNITITPVQAIDQNNLPVATGTFINGVVTVTTVIVPQTVSLSVVNVTGKPGDTVPVKVLLGSTVQLGALRVAVTLPAGFTLNGSVVNGTVFTGKNDQIQANANGQTVDVVLVTDGTAAGPGDLFTLPVKIPTTATSGDQPVGLSLTQAIDVNNKPVAAGVITGGKITVTPGGPTTPSPIVKVDDTTIAQGQTGNVTVELTSPSQLGALMFRLTLSSGLSVASPVTLTPGTLFNGKSDIEAANVRSNGQIVDVALVSPTSAKGPGVLFTLPVTAALTATDPQTITVSMVTASDVNNVAVPPGTPINGTIHIIPAVIPGLNPPLGITIGSVTGNAGDIVSFPVTLSTMTTVGAVHVKLCATGGLKFIGSDFTGSLFASPDVDQSNISADGTMLDTVLVSSGTHMGPGLLFTAKAQIPTTATAGQTFGVTICDANSISGIDGSNLPVKLMGTGVVSGGVITVGNSMVTPPTISVESVNLVPGQPATVTLRLNNAANIGGFDVTLQLSNPAIGTLVANSGKPADPKSTDVVQATTVGADKIRVVDVSAGTLRSGAVATFQIQPSATLKPWDSSVVTVSSATAVSADNKTISQLTLNPLGNGVLVDGNWVVDPGFASQAAASVANIAGADVAFLGYSNGQLFARSAASSAGQFGGKGLVDLGIGPIIRRPTVKSGFVYVTTSTGGVAKVDATNGTPAWKITLSAGRHPSTAPSVATDATGKTAIYVGTVEHVVVELDDASGAELATSPDLGAAVTADPAAGPVVVQDSKGNVTNGPVEVWVGAGKTVYQLDANMAQIKKQFPTGAEVDSPPFISPVLGSKDNKTATRIVAAGSGDGSLYVFNTGTGSNLGLYASGAPIPAATFVDWPSGTLPPTVYLVNTAGQLHAVSLAGLDLTQVGQTLSGKSLVTGLGNVNSSVIVIGSPKYGYTTNLTGSIFGVKLPTDPAGTGALTATVATPYAAFAPAASMMTSTVIVTLANGVTIALPFLK